MRNATSACARRLGAIYEHRRRLAECYEADPHMPRGPRPIWEDLDVAVLGGGFRCHRRRPPEERRRRGLPHHRARRGFWRRLVLEPLPRHPMRQRRLLLSPAARRAGFIPSKKFADGEEIQEHCQRIGKNFGLYRMHVFHTLISALRWDESIERWRSSRIATTISAPRFVIMALGPSMPKLPGIAGMRNSRDMLFTALGL